MVAGTAIEVVSVVAFFPGVELKADAQGNLTTHQTGNPPLFYGGLLVGSAVTAWGLYQLIDGYATTTLLRNQRYSLDLGVTPQSGYLALRF